MEAICRFVKPCDESSMTEMAKRRGKRRRKKTRTKSKSSQGDDTKYAK